MCETITKFLELAEKAFVYTKKRYWFNDTIYEKDELINEAYIKGSWKEDIKEIWIIRRMSDDMIHYLIHNRFGRTCRQFGKQIARGKITCQYLEEIGNVTQGWFSEVIFEPQYKIEQQENVNKILCRLPVTRRVRLAMFAEGYTKSEIAKKQNCTPEAIRISLNKSINHLRTII